MNQRIRNKVAKRLFRQYQALIDKYGALVTFEGEWLELYHRWQTIAYKNSNRMMRLYEKAKKCRAT